MMSSSFVDDRRGARPTPAVHPRPQYLQYNRTRINVLAAAARLPTMQGHPTQLPNGGKGRYGNLCSSYADK
jgi:hypothetical protein